MKRFAEMQPVLNYAVRHLDGDVTLGALARQAGISPFHFQRVFHETTGETPKQLTLRLRLERAAVMLLAGKLSILDIAVDCGFNSHEVFLRAFRKRYSVLPQRYRQRGLAGTAAGAQVRRHGALVAQIGPCVGLFHRVNFKELRSVMSYEIEKKTLPAQAILVVRRRVKRDQIAATIGATLPHLFVYAQQHGLALNGFPITRYVEIGPGMVTMEPGMRVAAGALDAAPPDAEVRSDTLAGEVVMTTHLGPYDQLTHAYAALEIWMDEHGLAAAGAPWEAYCNDPGEYPDPKDWKTEVYWPVRPV